LTYLRSQVTFAIAPLRRGKIPLARKILLADDSVTAQNMGRKILADAGYEVITVNNGSAALKKISEVKPDLVILDVYMPGYSGLEVCQRLKEIPDSSRVPVLLTVGKLEPFKPEEAQRVRAEAFIVKPFEASELLSMLSKLEDKVVPRSEPSKPGRFARAIASVEESARGRVQPANGDDSWKNRIGFPQQKKEAEEKVEDDAAIYNPINRDLRTVVATAAERSTEANASEQNKNKDEQAPIGESNVDVAAPAAPVVPQDVTPEEVAAIAAAAAQIQTLHAALKERDAAAEEIAAAVDNSNASEAMAEAPAPSDEVFTSARDAEEEKSQDSQDTPVTMAAGAEISVNSGAPRWTAVSVALAGDEAGISLEQEMQKAYATFAAEQTTAVDAAALPAPEANQPEAVPPVQEPAIGAPPVVAVANIDSVPESASVAATEVAEPISQEPPRSEPEPSLPVSEESPVASFAPVEPVASSEPVVALPHPEPQAAVPVAEPAQLEAPIESLPPQLTEPATAAIVDTAPVEEPGVEAVAPVLSESSPTQDPEPAISEAAAPSHSFTSFAPVPQQTENRPQEEQHEESQAESRQAESHPDEAESVKSTAAAWASWRQIRDANEPKPAPQPTPPEAEVQPPVQTDTPAEQPVDSAAMAVAAGAEQIAREVAEAPAQEPADVESIVDSVLADLRPRLMAEISRKMSEKK
jgi:twitching motility two-component system response regulator PilH